MENKKGKGKEGGRGKKGGGGNCRGAEGGRRLGKRGEKG